MSVTATMPQTQAKEIEARNLNLYYGDFLAVKDVNVRIPPNKVTALIGSSGCGKSTFLRSINRMHELIPGARVEGDVTVAQPVSDDVDL
jgi:phosphate transport system ATP-binding protein